MTQDVGRYFSLFAVQCLHEGCEEVGAALGYCRAHYKVEVEKRWDRLQAAGRTCAKPACFDEEQDWREFEVFSLDAPGSKARRADPCKDCTPSYQQAMAKAGRCEHQEVVFVRRLEDRLDPDIEGITDRKFSTWERACTGALGPVIQMPSMEARRAATTRHYQKMRASK